MSRLSAPETAITSDAICQRVTELSDVTYLLHHGAGWAVAGKSERALRTAALLAVAAGAVTSVTLLLRAGSRNSSLILLVSVFAGWVLLPFAVLGWANLISTRWSRATQLTLHCVTLVVALLSIACYSGLVPKPEGSPNVFMFVAVPPVSLLVALVVPIVAAIAHGRTRKRH
jgi:hypothetical protein